MMPNRLFQHGFYYFSLLAILALGFTLVYLNSSNKELQIAAVILTTFFYILWGILHHLLNHDLTSKIVVEYILIGSLGLAVIILLLKGGVVGG